MRARTGSLDIEEVDVVGGGVNHGPEGHRVRNLSVEPDVFVRGEKPGQFWANDSNDIAKHRDQNQATVEREDETSTARSPYGPFETVERSQLGVYSLGCTR